MWRYILAAALTLCVAGIAQASNAQIIKKYVQDKRNAYESRFQKVVDWLPADGEILRLPEQDALRRRGLYFDVMGRTRRLDAPEQLGCKGGFILEAHRGHPHFPENNISGVSSGFAARYNAVEVDAMLLADTTWVFHHDHKLGRSVQLRDYREQTVKQTNRQQFIQGREIDRDGSETEFPPETALPILIAAGGFINLGQYINIEIKDTTASCQALTHLDFMATSAIPASQVSYSVMGSISPLLCLRKANSESRMSVIQGPGRKALETWAKTHHGVELSKFKGRRQTQVAGQIVQGVFGSHTFPRVSDAKTLSSLQGALGPSIGLNVEIQDLVDNPDILTRARNSGIRVLTYTINDDEDHLKALRRLWAQGRLPDGAIVDTTPIKACKTIGLEI